MNYEADISNICEYQFPLKKFAFENNEKLITQHIISKNEKYWENFFRNNH